MSTEEKKLEITFGIQQKHIDLIEEKRRVWMAGPNPPEWEPLYNEFFWNLIGKEIGWAPFTICLHYLKHKANHP